MPYNLGMDPFNPLTAAQKQGHAAPPKPLGGIPWYFWLAFAAAAVMIVLEVA